MLELTLIVKVHEGLHARPAARFAMLAKTFQSNITLHRGTVVANAKSSVKLLLMAIKENDQITLKAEGADAAAALIALEVFLQTAESGIEKASEGQSIQPVVPTSVANPGPITPTSGQIQGIAASDGLALGPVYPFFLEVLNIDQTTIQDSEIPTELFKLEAAYKAVEARMADSLAGQEISKADKGIIAALKELLADPDTYAEVAADIKSGMNAVASVDQVSRKNARELSQADDVYLRARADDVLAIGRQVCLQLQGKKDIDLQGTPAGSIIVADDIGAFDLARAPLQNIVGLVCSGGGATSHIAIIARTHSIPAVFGLGEAIHRVKSAKRLMLDGRAGILQIDPDNAAIAFFQKRIEELQQEREKLKSFKSVIPKRRDGALIEVAANIGSLDEIAAAKNAGAMGVGLFRTELLFMQHRVLPTEQEQFESYREALQAFSPDPVIIRTLDVGGDKPVPGIDFPKEENPFLGWRGIRMCLDCPQVFKPQLRALLRAAMLGKLKVMLPMVSDVSEIMNTNILIEECRNELRQEGVAFGKFELGIMVETPAAVFQAEELAKHVAFFSIGTNDLTQYVMAADRLNPRLAKLNDVANPAVMTAIAAVARAGTKAGIMVGMCGEAAGREDLVPLFIEMGITEFSMSASRILPIKKLLSAHA